MLSLAHVGRGAEDYHLKAVGQGASLYYSERGEVAGRWLGSGAAALGLGGKVEDGPLLALLAGYEPAARQEEVKADKRTERRFHGRQLVRGPAGRDRLPGIDATFKAPKSVSLLWALGDRVSLGEERGSVADLVTRAHDAAVESALGWLEEQAAWGRRGHGGAEQVRTKGLVAAGFRHRTSRLDDPHLHTHVLVANLAEREDGGWGALDGRLLYAWAKTAGYLYEAELRSRLSTELGVEWTEVRNGIAEVEGVHRAVLDAFSKRRHELLAAAAEVTERVNRERRRLGLAPVEADSEEAKDIASHETRARKLAGAATEELRARWRQEAAALGYGEPQLLAQLERVPPDRRGPLPEAPAALARRARELTQQASTFGLRDAVQAVCASRRSGLTVREARLLTAAMLEDPEVVPVSGVPSVRRQDVIVLRTGAASRIPTDSQRYTTREMLGIEQGIVDAAARRVREEEAVRSEPEPLEAAISEAARGGTLGPDQAAMAIEACLSGRPVQVVNAPPGSGKTAAARVIVRAMERSGVPVIGTSLSARARDELREGAGLTDVRTLAMLRSQVERGRPLPPGSMVIVDEAGMVDSRTMRWLLDEAARAGASVLLMGDHRQLPEIDAGGAFRGLWSRLGGIALQGNRRQEAEWERQAIAALREGRVQTALDWYEAHGRIAYGEAAEMATECVLAYREARLRGEQVVMESELWADVDHLNALVHEIRIAAGEVEREGIQYFGQPIARGDEVRLQRGDERGLGVINGTEGVVVNLDPAQATITIEETRSKRRIELPRRFLYDESEPGPALRLAYCRTSYGVQGGTWNHAAYLFTRPEQASAESLLVDLTRGKRANYVFFAGRRPEEETHLPARDTTPPRELFAKAMRREHAKTMALDLVAQAGQAVEEHEDGPRLEIDWGTAPATEAQLAWIADLGKEAVLQGRLPTWVEASLLIDTTGEVAEGWLREQGATEAEARDVVESARRRLTGEDVAEMDRPSVVEPNALRALEERLQAELDRDGTTGMRGRMLEAARRWESRLQATQPADRGPELLEERLRQLEEKDERSRAQDLERDRLRSRRRWLLRGQQPRSEPSQGRGDQGRDRDQERRQGR